GQPAMAIQHAVRIDPAAKTQPDETAKRQQHGAAVNHSSGTDIDRTAIFAIQHRAAHHNGVLAGPGAHQPGIGYGVESARSTAQLFPAETHVCFSVSMMVASNPSIIRFKVKQRDTRERAWAPVSNAKRESSRRRRKAARQPSKSSNGTRIAAGSPPSSHTVSRCMGISLQMMGSPSCIASRIELLWPSNSEVWTKPSAARSRSMT